MMILQKKWLARVFLTLSITTIFISGGCGQKQAGQGTAAPLSHSAGMLVANETTFSNVPVYSDGKGLIWVPLEETAKSMGLDLHNIDGSLILGNTDAAYSAKENQTQASVGDNPVELPHAPRMFEGKPFMTTEAVSALLGTPVSWNAQHSQVVITPVDQSLLSQQQSLSTAQPSGSDAAGRSFSVNTVDKSQIVSFAKQYLGTPYQFGAGPYKSTRVFDCSSFVQYVFGHFGVNLPRSSRSQAHVGQNVAINQLQPGDILFFGRSSGSLLVTHVGIYAGNGQIVHTFGAPGVTVTDFAGNWRRRFLFAKRVA